MVLFLWASLFLGITGELLKSEACPSNNTLARCKYVFGNVCFDFVGASKNWSEARNSCEMQGGELLKLMNVTIKNFLENIITESTGSFTWWLGEDVKPVYHEPFTESGDVSKDNFPVNCTYMKLNPYQLVTMSNCSQRRGFLCTHNLRYLPAAKNLKDCSHGTKSRPKRDVTYLDGLLQEADKELRRMETEVDEPTNENRDKFIQNLLDATKKLSSTETSTNIIHHIINCTTAILLLSKTKCDILSNPNPESFHNNIFEIFRHVGVLTTQVPEKTVIKFPTGTLYLSSHTPASLSEAVLGSEKEEHIVLPRISAFQAQVGNAAHISIQLAVFHWNVHPSDENITGSIFNIILTHKSSEIKLANLTDMIELYFPRPNASLQVTNRSFLLEKDKKALTTLNISDPNATVFFDVEPSRNVSLLLCLAHGSPPSPNTCRNTTILSHIDGYRWMITPEMLDQTAGTWYIDARLSNSNVTSGIKLKITSFMTKCMYWNTVRERWSIDGCWVGIKSTPRLTQCLCNHLTMFGTSFFVLPNYVDISRTAELFATVTQNYVVLALLCAFFGLYLIILLWACYADRRSHSKRKMTLLEDNHPGAQYNYLISVQTGSHKNSGTSAKVTVKLTGTEAESETHNLTDPNKPVFEKGAVDIFILATPFPLGEMRNVKLQHDNSGSHPSWYIAKVTVQDLQTQQLWYFLCNCWLSADHGDGVTKKNFSAAKVNEISSFRNIFQTRTSTGFRDEHIWVSVVNPPSRSPFTRVQRVSCCMSLLLCTMAINIAFWNIPADPNSPVLFSIVGHFIMEQNGKLLAFGASLKQPVDELQLFLLPGSLEITWQEIIVAVECGLLMFPINILIITIFRSIKPRLVSKAQQDNPEETWNAQAVTISTILKETEELISLVSMSPKNNIPVAHRLECTADLWIAMDTLHELTQLMQGESESTPHWVHCSKFLLCNLCHLLLSLKKVDAKNFQSPEDYQRAIDTANMLVCKAEMVYSSHKTYCPPPVKDEKKQSAGCWLPWWCVFLGWFLLLSISGVSTYFTLLYGFQYGKQKSIKWVISLGLSLFQSIFILQPLKVLGVAVFFALLLKPVRVEENEVIKQLLENQEKKCRLYSGRDTL